MRKLLLVAAQTYAVRARKGWFLLYALGAPLGLALALVLDFVFVFYLFESDRRPLGVVDLADVIQDWAPLAPEQALSPQRPLRRYASEAEAAAALACGEVQAYYLVDQDYLATGQVTEVTSQNTLSNSSDQITALLRRQLLQGIDSIYRQRLLAQARSRELPHRLLGTSDGRLETPLKLAVAWGLLGVLMVITNATNAFLMRMLVEEQSNRLAEILLSSVTAEQLVLGKVAGMVALGLTPVVVWGTVLGLALPWVPGLIPEGMPFPWLFIALCLALLLPAYALTALTAALLGTVSDADGPGYRNVALLTVGAPMMIWGTAASVALYAPHSLGSVLLSLFPLTAPVALALRAARTAVPLWQVAGGLAGLYLALALSLPLAARLYRAAWLAQGQNHKLRSLWLALGGG